MSFFSKIKKIFSWIPFLWKLDDGSYISLYQVNSKQINDIQTEILKFSDIFEGGIDFCFEMEECKRNLNGAITEPDINVTQRYVDRAFEIMKQKSMDWWI